MDGSYPKGWELPNKSHWTTTCSDIWSQFCGHYEQPMFELSRHQIDTRACQPTTPTFLRPQALKRSRALKITPKKRGLQQIALDSSRFFRWPWRKNREIGSTKGNKTKSFGNLPKTKSWGMCNENLDLFKVTFYVLPREITMKPPFGWIFFTFSKLGMQIQVN